jgi:hypothetical protein
MKTTTKKCKCGTDLHYENIHGMRIATAVLGPVVELSPGCFGCDSGYLVYKTYCPGCKTHSNEKVKE